MSTGFAESSILAKYVYIHPELSIRIAISIWERENDYLRVKEAVEEGKREYRQSTISIG